MTIFRAIYICVLLAFLLPQSQGQNVNLARQYYTQGEFEKAASLFKQLHEKNPNQEYYYERYLACLLELEAYKDAEKLIKRNLKAFPKRLERYVDYGNLYELRSEQKKAEDQYEKAIKLLSTDQNVILKLARTFQNKQKYDYAIRCYNKGEELLKQEYTFAYELGNVYRLKGEQKEMIEEYLNALIFRPKRLPNVQSFFQRELSANADGFSLLKKALYARMQADAESTVYPELLLWTFMQEGNFPSAFRQAKALDRRLGENGSRVYQLARIAVSEKDYETGIKAYTYLVEKGEDFPYYLSAKQEMLAAKRKQLTEGYAFSAEELQTLEKEYEDFLNLYGRNASTAKIARELAELEALYIHNLPKAIKILEEVIAIRNLHRSQRMAIKLELGDYYLMSGDIWESSLFYSQVDKEMRDAPMGEVARFKNAKLSYYKGDFEWAQDQLDVLKGSTSELISNDAIEISVFIMEHYNLDTTALPMQRFAQSELLRFQNKDKEAELIMDSLMLENPKHGLADDILMARYEIAMKQRNFQRAKASLQTILDEHKEGILVDNALFKLAELYEKHLDAAAKAQELYQKILFDHEGSLFTVEARKRFRRLRGDGV